MSRYIDKDELLSSFKNSYLAACKWEEEAKDEEIKTRANSAVATFIECYMRVKEMPTDDVKEVRHEKWIKIRSRIFICSYCKRVVYLDGINVTDKVTDKNETKLLRELYPYCHCGAKMDKETEE